MAVGLVGVPPGKRVSAGYSPAWTSASRALRSGIVMVLPSILMTPEACSRLRFRETSSRTVPIWKASS